MAKPQRILIWHDEKDFFSVNIIKEQQKSCPETDFYFWSEADIHPSSGSRAMEIFENELNQSDVIAFLLKIEFSKVKYHKNRKLLNLFYKAKDRGAHLVVARTYLRTIPEHLLFKKSEIYQHNKPPLCDCLDEVARQNLDEFLVFLRTKDLKCDPVKKEKGGITNSMKKNKKVFISHSSEQIADANNLHDILKNAGYDPILDSHVISGGQNFHKKIATLINESTYFVLLITEESLKSSWVLCEITLAYSYGLLKEEKFLPFQLGKIDDKLANKIPWIPKNSCHWTDGTQGFRLVVEWLNNQ